MTGKWGLPKLRDPCSCRAYTQDGGIPGGPPKNHAWITEYSCQGSRYRERIFHSCGLLGPLEKLEHSRRIFESNNEAAKAAKVNPKPKSPHPKP